MFFAGHCYKLFCCQVQLHPHGHTVQRVKDDGKLDFACFNCLVLTAETNEG